MNSTIKYGSCSEYAKMPERKKCPEKTTGFSENKQKVLYYRKFLT